MAIDDLYRLKTQVRTAEGVMSFHMDYEMIDGVTTTQSLTLLCTDFINNKLDLYVLACSDDIEVDQCRCDALTNQVELPGFVNLNNKEGVLLGESLPNNSAAVMKLITTAPNAKHNGRIFLPGTPEDTQADGTMTTGQQTLWNTFGTALLLDISLAGPEDAVFSPRVVSFILNGAPRAAPVGFAILSATTSNRLRQQRRRGGRRQGLSS